MTVVIIVNSLLTQLLKCMRTIWKIMVTLFTTLILTAVVLKHKPKRLICLLTKFGFNLSLTKMLLNSQYSKVKLVFGTSISLQKKKMIATVKLMRKSPLNLI